MTEPKVTIIMATYNRAHFIAETLSSIQNQTYTNWECLIIDDGGDDNTIEVITPTLEQDSRFKYLKRTDNYKKGLPGCRNYGLDLATGNFIIFFDDDDIVHPDNLKICIEILSDENLDFCHYQKLAFEKENPLIENASILRKVSLSKADIEEIITEKIGLASCTVMWKRNCFEKVRFNENLMYAEEWECYSRIISNNFKGTIIDSILYFNRKHENSNTADFYNNNPFRLASKKEAIVLILKELKEKQLLTNSIVLYFVTLSLSFKDFNLFNQILEILDLSIFKKFKLIFFYTTYPLRLSIYKIKKRLRK